MACAGKDDDMATGAVFDCDGTLIDSMEAWYEVQNDLARRAGIEPSDELTAALSPLTIPEVGDYFFERYGLGSGPDDVVRMLDEGMVAYYTERAKARPGALDFVRRLNELGIPCSVASSSPQRYLQPGLACAGFMPYLQAVVSVEDVAASKRSPAVYNQACKLMGTRIEDTWGFEDSLYALNTLAAAGYKTVGVYDNDDAGTYADLAAVADIAVRSFEELDPERFG